MLTYNMRIIRMLVMYKLLREDELSQLTLSLIKNQSKKCYLK